MNTITPTPPPRWNPGRFLKTLSYFGALPLLGSSRWVQRMLGIQGQTQGNGAALGRQMGVVLVVGGLHPVAQTLVCRLQRQRYQVRWITSLAGEADDRVEVLSGDLSQLQTRSPQVLQNVRTVVGCLTASEETAFGELVAAIAPQLNHKRHLLFDFTCSNDLLQQTWGSLDDVVMGGVSESGMRQDSEGAVFGGHVSTANAGGFASVRTRNFEPPLNLTGHEGLELEVKGDGNRYKLMVRSESRWDSVAYAASFDTIADTWLTVRIPFAALLPVFRARTMQNAGALDLSQVHAFQLMLSKFEYDGILNPHFTPGRFQLRVRSLKTYGAAPLPQVVAAIATDQSLTRLRDCLQPHCLAYALFRVKDVTAAGGGRSLTVLPQDAIPGAISSTDLAELCGAAIAHPLATGVTATIAEGDSICAVGDWDCLFRQMH